MFNKLLGIILLISLMFICIVIIFYAMRDMSKSIKEYNQEEKIINREAKKRAKRRQIHYY